MMKLLTINDKGMFTLGVKTDEGIVHVAKLAAKFPEKAIHTTMEEVIASGESGVRSLKEALTLISKKENEQLFIEDDEIQWGPAITNPSKIICIGLNYRKHADEIRADYPKYPILFNKFSNALTGHLSNIAVPKSTERLDYEVELGIIIGKQAKYVAEEKALDYVFGYCTTNDLSARDVQKHSSQWLAGKSNDGFAPVGPYIVTKDAVPNPDNLKIKTTVNGKVEQHSNTADMIFNCAALISYISHHMTLEPGDLIMTGTPEGVIIGRPMEERVYLQPGDEVTVEVEKLGALTNFFIEEK